MKKATAIRRVGLLGVALLAAAIACDALAFGTLTPATSSTFVTMLAIPTAWILATALLDAHSTLLQMIGALGVLPAGAAWVLSLGLAPIVLVSATAEAFELGPVKIGHPLAALAGMALGWSGARWSLALIEAQLEAAREADAE